MEYKMKLLAIAGICATLHFFGTGCYSSNDCDKYDDDSAVSTDVESLYSTKWVMKAFEATCSEIPYLAFIVFDETDQNENGMPCNASGSTGCNAFWAKYTADDTGMLSIQYQGNTEIWCEDLEHESEFMHALSSATHFEFYGELLLVFYDDDKWLTFEKDPGKQLQKD